MPHLAAKGRTCNFHNFYDRTALVEFNADLFARNDEKNTPERCSCYKEVREYLKMEARQAEIKNKNNSNRNDEYKNETIDLSDA